MSKLVVPELPAACVCVVVGNNEISCVSYTGSEFIMRLSFFYGAKVGADLRNVYHVDIRPDIAADFVSTHNARHDGSEPLLKRRNVLSFPKVSIKIIGKGSLPEYQPEIWVSLRANALVGSS